MAEAKDTTISQAVVKALGELHNPKRTGEANAGAYGYTYPELDKIIADCREVFAKHGLAILQDTSNDNGTIGVRTIILHTSGEKLESSWLHIQAGSGAQANGSAITYGRRYSLMAFLGLAGEDDDGAAATESATSTPKAKPVGNTPTPSDGPAPEKKEKTPGNASFKSLGLARGLFVQRTITLGPEDSETPEVTEVRREQNCFAIAEWLKDRGFESNGHDDELLYMNQSTLSKVIDKVKAEIADMDVG